jgi:hypothetical protein
MPVESALIPGIEVEITPQSSLLSLFEQQSSHRSITSKHYRAFGYFATNYSSITRSTPIQSRPQRFQQGTFRLRRIGARAMSSP